jgi:hypothetical protein
MPITFPPCYAAYAGGIGVVVMALARGRRIVKFGAALPPTLAVLTVGGCLMCHKATAPFVAIATLWFAVMVPWSIARRMPSERALALIALMQGLGSTAWATLLVTDKDGMWGAGVTLVAGIALVIGAAAWLDSVAQQPDLPRAIVR